MNRTRSNIAWGGWLGLVWLSVLPLTAAGQTPEEAAQPSTADGPGAAGSSALAGSPLADSLKGESKSDYDAGKILYDDQDYKGALVKFQHAYERSGDLRLLWNMAVCEKNLRRYARVFQLVDRYWREGNSFMSAAHRAEVQGVLQTVRTLISSVHLHVNEDGANIYVDNELVGTTPLAGPLLVDLGKRQIRASKTGFLEQEVVQHFAGGSEIVLSLVLTQDAQDGRLSVIAGEGQTIRVDDNIVGTARWQGSLPAGEHQLRVTGEDKQPYTKEVVVEAGQIRTLYVSLEESESGIPGWVWIGAGAVVAGGIGTAAYILLKPSGRTEYQLGTLTPGYVQLMLKH